MFRWTEARGKGLLFRTGGVLWDTSWEGCVLGSFDVQKSLVGCVQHRGGNTATGGKSQGGESKGG